MYVRSVGATVFEPRTRNFAHTFSFRAAKNVSLIFFEFRIFKSLLGLISVKNAKEWLKYTISTRFSRPHISSYMSEISNISLTRFPFDGFFPNFRYVVGSPSRKARDRQTLIFGRSLVLSECWVYVNSGLRVVILPYRTSRIVCRPTGVKPNTSNN